MLNEIHQVRHQRERALACYAAAQLKSSSK